MADYIISCHGTYEYDFPLSHALTGIKTLVVFKNHAGTFRIEKSQKIFDDLLAGNKVDASEIWTEMQEGRCYPSLTLRYADDFASGIFKVGSGGAFAIKKYGTGWVGTLKQELDWLTQHKAEKVYLMTCTKVVSKIDPKVINGYFDQVVELSGGQFGVERVV
ncbi:hypothetical protein M8A51_25530 [Schlegelella sp. S2-27]|uniref:Uncharacterized protein n=1 Tax=Caldimonas mangrovi TaxID=2944811 RepID=A0ABT0YVW9_9BURK|nr:hypothetical protein [Caldimonas mangrovi]MCM5682900.1 hypothetical protein [Caldimonas mangrovi]